MNIQALRFRVITHMTDSQSLQFAQNLLQQTPDQQPPFSPQHIQKIPINKIVTEEHSNSKNGFSKPLEINPSHQSILMNQNSRESLIDKFSTTTEIEKLRSEYSRLWYEKLALETSMERMIEQNTKKDEMIRILKKQLAQNMRHTAFPRH